MNFRRWFVTGLLVSLTASFAASTGVMVVLRDREQNRRLDAEEALLQSRQTNQQLEKELASHKERSIQLEREFLTLKHNNQLTLVLLKGVERKLSRLQNEMARERSEKQTLAKERSSLSNALLSAQSEKKSLKTELSKLMAHSPEEVDLGQIVVSATPALEGKVLVVNHKFQFVVVNLGSEKELSVGTLLNIYRQGQLIGRVQVEQVRENVAACRILPELTLQDIQENDAVKEL